VGGVMDIHRGVVKFRRFDWVISSTYFLLLILIAIFYQYSLNFQPCQLCVQIRAVIFSLIGLSLMRGACSRIRWLILIFDCLSVLMLVLALKLSYVAHEIEVGSRMAFCAFDAGFPAFLPLDSWFPIFFQVGGICGKSPSIIFGITMVDGLFVALSIPLIWRIYLLSFGRKHILAK
jgi:disulfide bond formation protein DsbB